MSSRRTISSLPPESVTKLVTGGLGGLRVTRRWREDLPVRLDRCCCASIKWANDTSARKKRIVRLSIVIDWPERAESAASSLTSSSSNWRFQDMHHLYSSLLVG